MLNFCLTYCNIASLAATAFSWKPYNANLLLGYVNCTPTKNIIEAHRIATQQETFDMMQQSKPQKPTSREWVRPLWLLTTVGWSVALSLIIPTAIGYWVDQPAQLNRQPLFTLIGFGVGTLVAFFTLYRLLRQFYNEQKEKNKEEVKKQQ